MTSLFQLPKVSGLANSKLTFTATGTTVPQDIYQDEGLTTPHTNPVVADINGIFAPIYLDPALPSYRVKYTTSADVLIYQSDGIPSNQNKTTSMRLESAFPELVFYDTDGTVDQRKVKIRVFGNAFQISALNDSESVATLLFESIAGVNNLRAGTTIGGAALPSSESGTFTATLTGCTTSPTGTVRYSRSGNIVTLHIPAISGTSNTTAMTLTGLPSALQVGTTTQNAVVRVTDNGTASFGTAAIAAPGSAISFGIGASGSGTFTGSGTKGVLSSIMTYEQN